MLIEAVGFFVTCWGESQFKNEVLNICGGNDKQADSVLKILQPVIRCSFKSFNAYIEGTPEDRKKANKEYHLAVSDATDALKDLFKVQHYVATFGLCFPKAQTKKHSYK